MIIAYRARHVAYAEGAHSEADVALAPLPPPADGVVLAGEVGGGSRLEVEVLDGASSESIVPLEAGGRGQEPLVLARVVLGHLGAVAGV